MMSETNNSGKLIEFREAANHLPQTRSTINRWATAGLIGRNGQRIRLRSKLIGGRRFTSLAWIDEFIDALDAAPDPVRAVNQEDILA